MSHIASPLDNVLLQYCLVFSEHHDLQQVFNRWKGIWRSRAQRKYTYNFVLLTLMYNIYNVVFQDL